MITCYSPQKVTLWPVLSANFNTLVPPPVLRCPKMLPAKGRAEEQLGGLFQRVRGVVSNLDEKRRSKDATRGSWHRYERSKDATTWVKEDADGRLTHKIVRFWHVGPSDLVGLAFGLCVC